MFLKVVQNFGVYPKSWTNNLKTCFLFVKTQFKKSNLIMNKRWKKYINEFKMLILELLEEGKIKGIEYLYIKKASAILMKK